MTADDMLRNLLFKRFHAGKVSFDLLEGLLAVCITGVGFLLRTSFETGLPHWPYLLAEWYLAFAAGVLIWRLTKSRRRTITAYSLLMILPTVIAEGSILKGDACAGALLVICALFFICHGQEGKGGWLFTLTLSAALLLDVRYVGLMAVCLVLWQNERLKSVQLLVLLGAGAARFVRSYRLWLRAGYTLTSFHWPNIYGIVGNKAVQGQLIDPVALVGLFLAVGLMLMAVWLFGQGRMPSLDKEPAFLPRLFLFFILLAVYFLPYMDQSCGYLPCILSVVCFLLEPKEFLVPLFLQIAVYAGYQECFNGESMMPMALFSVIQFLVLAYLGVRLLEEAGVISICSRKN